MNTHEGNYTYGPRPYNYCPYCGHSLNIVAYSGGGAGGMGCYNPHVTGGQYNPGGSTNYVAVKPIDPDNTK